MVIGGDITKKIEVKGVHFEEIRYLSPNYRTKILLREYYSKENFETVLLLIHPTEACELQDDKLSCTDLATSVTEFGNPVVFLVDDKYKNC